MILHNRFVFFISLFVFITVTLFMTGCSSPKILTSTYMDSYVRSDPVTVYPKSNTDNIATKPYITYQRLRARYYVSGLPSQYRSYDEESTVKNRKKFFSRDSVYFYSLKNYKNAIWDTRVQKREFYFDYSTYIDVAVSFETNKLIPLYRVIITPKRNITRQEIESLPEDGIIFIDKYDILSGKQKKLKLKFKYPKNKRLINSQFVSEWIYCPQCLTNVNISLRSTKGLAELDRKAEELFPLSPVSVYTSDFHRQKSQLLNIKGVQFEADKNIDSGIDKFTTAESLQSQRVMLAKISDLKDKKRKAASANTRYADFIKTKYKPLTAKNYIKHLHCGGYSEGNRNNPSKDGGYLLENKRYSSCLLKAFKKYDIVGYTQLYPILRDIEKHLWALTLGAKRTNIISPDSQINVFKNRFKDIEQASGTILDRIGAIAYRNDRAARDRKIWSGAFSQAMKNIKQEQTFTNNHLLVVDTNNNVMTVGEQKRRRIARAKMQVYLENIKKESEDSDDKESTNSEVQSSGTREGTRENYSQQSSNGVRAEKDDQASEDRDIQKQERLEKEKHEKERFEKERLEKERLEKERLRKERLEKERLEREKIVYTVALTWQNKAGYWFACGPVQCIWAGERTEQEALNFVIGNKSIAGQTSYYGCNQYSLSSMAKDTAGDFSEAKIRRLSKCSPRR